MIVTVPNPSGGNQAWVTFSNDATIAHKVTFSYGLTGTPRLYAVVKVLATWRPAENVVNRAFHLLSFIDPAVLFDQRTRQVIDAPFLPRTEIGFRKTLSKHPYSDMFKVRLNEQ